MFCNDVSCNSRGGNDGTSSKKFKEHIQELTAEAESKPLDEARNIVTSTAAELK